MEPQRTFASLLATVFTVGVGLGVGVTACGGSSGDTGETKNGVTIPTGPTGAVKGSGSCTPPAPIPAWDTAVACTGKDAGKRAAVLCVDGRNGNDAPTGTGSAPFPTVSAAVAAARSGDTILVAAGTYQGNVGAVGKALALYGGFPGAAKATYASGKSGDFTTRDIVANGVILQGKAGGPVLGFRNAPKITIDGFTVRGGTGHFDGSEYKGGGIYCDSDTRVEIAIVHNTIEGNNVVHGAGTDTRGGGIYVDTASGIVEDNVIRTNAAGRGGGLAWVRGASGIIRGNTISGNTVSPLEGHPCGGGLYVSGTGMRIENNTIASNIVAAGGFGWGGGIYGFEGTLAFDGNTVTDNSAPNQGSGVFFEQNVNATLSHELYFKNRCPARGGAAVYVDSPTATVTLDGTTIADHACPRTTDGGNAVYAEGGATVRVTNSIVATTGGRAWYTATTTPPSTITVTSTVTDTAIAGNGNIKADPLFANAAAHDYSLRSRAGRFDGVACKWVKDSASSPAIDSADPDAPFDAEPAPNGGRANGGHQGNTPFASKTGP